MWTTSRQAIHTVNDFLLPPQTGAFRPPPYDQLNPMHQRSSYYMHIWNLRNAQADLRSLMRYNGEGRRPLFPIQAEPEAEIPFMKYIVTTSPVAPGQWWHLADEVTYAIYDTNVERSGHIANAITMLLRRTDETARDLNRLGDQNYDFLTSYLVSSIDPEPPTQEGGRHIRAVSFHIEYVTKQVLGTP